MTKSSLRPTTRPLVLLFYDGFEWRAREGRIASLKAQVRRMARWGWRTLRRKQVYTGFYTAFIALRESLEHHGCDVRVNDFVTARALPDYPIGIAGYPSVLKAVPLPNPKIFGPGDFGTPDQAVQVAADPSMKLLIQPSDWFRDFYRASCGDKVVTWFAGIDTDRWRDQSDNPKAIDVLIYDKVRWNQQSRVPETIGRLLAHLTERGLNSRVLRYGCHHRDEFAAALAASRSLAFICEHETQGLAYQEAMAANVPVFAWDEGEFVDPILNPAAPAGLSVSSVPYFDDRCGRRYRIAETEQAFDQFWAMLNSYRPREYVMEQLSMATSAKAYLDFYDSIG